MSDPLLSSLCSICHLKPHNYRCPRCFILTCSLPCIKRHKQWAECNGARDPSIYIKHRDLATPKGIDHDYNYLTSIERELDHAEKNATARGVALEEEVRPKAQRYEKGELALKNAFARCGVVVARAPKGMSRSKLNATRLTNKTKTLRWTVEWIRPDGSKAIGMCPETQPLSEAYAAHLKWLNPGHQSKRRKPNHEYAEQPSSNVGVLHGTLEHPLSDDFASTSLQDDTISPLNSPQATTTSSGQSQSVSGEPVQTHSQLRKRRRKGQVERATSTLKAQVQLDSERQLQEWKEAIDAKRKLEEKGLGDAYKAATKKERPHKEDEEREKLEGPETVHSSYIVQENVARKESDAVGEGRHAGGSNGAIPFLDPNHANIEHISSIPKPSISLTMEPKSEDNLAFYLHHPSLPSRHPVLIPLSPSSTLATSLSNRLVLEFPTIYVLHRQPNDELPEGFVREDDFFRKAKKELVQELEEGQVQDGENEVQREGRQGVQEKSEVNERRLVEVLGKDLKEITGVV